MRNILKKYCYPILKIISRLYVGCKTRHYNNQSINNSRWYQLAFAECGKNLRIFGSPLIQKPELIYIGDNCAINEGAQLNPNGRIYIGNNVTISSGAKIIANTLDTKGWVNNRLSKRGVHVGESIYIADGTWLCTNAIILPGVSIKGKGVIVAAGSVVTKDISEDFVIVGGIPAKIIKRLK